MSVNGMPIKPIRLSSCAFKRILVPLLAVLLLTACSDSQFPNEITRQLPARVDFSLHVKPILSDRCFTCHGPDEAARKADLRLDIAEAALANRGDADSAWYAIVAGNPEQSEVFARLMSEDPDIKMPPPESNLALSDVERATLERWIQQGAEYKPHWSLTPPKSPAVPRVSASHTISNPVDNFILAGLDQAELTPSPRAQKAVLARRAAFDLTGLPPELPELDAFLADDSKDAWKHYLEGLLAKSAYGERMASNWLDLARYADSHGYQDDGMRRAWPWRDWVIKQFNENLPFDKFVLWQLAGDLLDNPTDEQLLATTFNRNHLQTMEGGVVPEEYRTEYVADRTHTFGTAFLGMTMECARCHDHKYDPISQKEYYQLFAFFNNVDEAGQICYVGEPTPTLILMDAAERDTLRGIEDEIAKKLAETDPEKYETGFQRWLKSGSKSMRSPRGLQAAYALDRMRVQKTSKKNKETGKVTVSTKYLYRNRVDRNKPASIRAPEENHPGSMPGKFGQAVVLVGDGGIDLGKETGDFDRHDPFTVTLWVRVLADSVQGPFFSNTRGYFDGLRGYELWLNEDGTLTASLNHMAPANALTKRTREAIAPHAWIHLAVTYDGSSSPDGLQIYRDGEKMPTQVLANNLKRSLKGYGRERTNWIARGNLTIGRAFEESLEKAAVDEFHVFNRKLSAIEVKADYGDRKALARLHGKPAADRTPADTIALRDYYLGAVDKRYGEAAKALSASRAQETKFLTDREEIMVMGERQQPRKTFILKRGQYDAPTDEVMPETPAVLGSLPDDLPRNRLGLAKWLLSEQNPLFARVAVNRFWQMLFGAGLVKTSDDFGNQGALPTHPELLDWLAVEFRSNGWNVKGLLKQIMLSSTYQQSSVNRPELMDKDPENRLLARGPRYRLTAEMVRDHALAVSGLLVDSLGGPSVYPYQPPGLWKETATRNVTEYKQGSGDDLYRRSLYTIWKRTSPPPSMISFDASERNLCNVRRQKTSTPLQALVLLNDPQYVEAARKLAERLLHEGGTESEARIRYGFLLAIGREPDPQETKALQDLLVAEKDRLAADDSAAISLLMVGEAQADSTLDAKDIAAHTLLANVLLNHDGFVTKQ